MSSTYTTTTQVDPVVNEYYDRALLMVADDELIHTQAAEMKTMPKNSGRVFKFRRPGRLAVATTPLTEAVTPSADQLSKTDIETTPQQYGALVFISDEVEFTNEDNVLNWATERLGEQRGRTIDTIVRDVIVAGSTTLNAANGVNAQSPTEVSKKDLQILVRTLKGNNAKMITSMISAGQGQGTAPIRPAFIGFADVDLDDDFRNISGWKGVESYPTVKGLLKGEEGSTGGIRWCFSTNAKRVTTTNPDTWKLVVCGKEAYGMVLGAGSEKTIFKPRGSGEDRLNQRASLGWKEKFSCKILNDDFLCVMTVTRSDAVNT